MSEIGQKIIATVRAKAAEYPGYVYEKPQVIHADGEPGKGCVYVHDGAPSCILGHGLWENGEMDATIEGKPLNNYPFINFGDTEFEVMERMDADEVDWLSEVQAQQDGGTCWADAVDDADMKVDIP